MGETATRILLGFVIAGAVVLVAGIVVLIWLLASGTPRDDGARPGAAQVGSAPSTDRGAALHLAPGERIMSMARGPDDLVFLLEAADGSQILRLVDPASGDTLRELPVVEGATP
ncbi:hypothetical protein [Geminicoccus roseus]|uniref:hypothetical protein n=1 Tax=Geminicoccus roseus TaxID=404900 RepID=UPI0004138C94|nr:hypothetical protein [Geminicoccus roseus]